jgi:hypothetical protein
MISENKESRSSFVACLQLKDSDRVRHDLIKPIVGRFFSARDIVDYKEISRNSEISDLDFSPEYTKINYFYDFIFDDIRKDTKGKIEFSIKYILTLDKKNCQKQCEKTGVFYDEITLNKKPACYFIYISIEEIFSFLRKNTPPLADMIKEAIARKGYQEL